MTRGVIIAGAAALVAAGIGAVALPGLMQGRALEALKTRTLAELVYVQGGDFRNGTYSVTWQKPDGSRTDLPVRDASQSQTSTDVTLPSYYLQAHEADNADFDMFLAATGRPKQYKSPQTSRGTAGVAAEMTWSEARDFCDWLGGVAGLDMRLPTENEWEFAARARGGTPPYATDNGQFLEGENTHDTVIGNNPTTRGLFGPSPMGFYNMADGLYEWVGDMGRERIAKGGSNVSSAAYETIPSRAVIEGFAKTADTVTLSDNAARYDAIKADTVYLFNATARCVADVAQAPAQSGIGTAPDLDAIGFPTIYVWPF